MYEIRYHILLMIEKVTQERIDENLAEEDHRYKIRFYFLLLLMSNNMKLMWGSANFAVVTFAVDFRQLSKVVFLSEFRRLPN